MNNLLKNIIMCISAVMLLTSTLILGVQNGINIVKNENSGGEKHSIMPNSIAENDNVKLPSVHPIIQTAEAAKEIDNKEIDNEIKSEGYAKKIDYNKGESDSNLESGSENDTDPQFNKVNEVTIKAEKLQNGQYAYLSLIHI